MSKRPARFANRRRKLHGEELESRRLLAVLLSESFEAGSTSQFTNDTYVGDSGLVSVPDAFHNDENDFWIRTNGSDPAIRTRTSATGSPSYNGQNGSFYWAGEDLDDTGATTDGVVPGGNASDTQVLEINNVDISGHNNLVFTGLFAADGTDPSNTTPFRYDAGEGLMVEYSIDGGAFVKGLEFRTEFVSGDTTNLQMRHDADMDGFGEGALITPTFTSYGFSISTLGSSLDLRITADLDASDEEMAFDLLEINGDPIVGNLAPTIVASDIQDVGEAGIAETVYEFTVTYSDNTAIDVSTIDTSDVTVTGPGGIGNVPVTGVSVDVNTNGTPRTATYSFTPPGGSWDPADNGAYTVNMVGNQVGDDDGSQAFVAAGAIGTFNVVADNNTNPSVTNFVAFDVAAADQGTADHSFTVEYSDGGVIDASTIDVNDITVTGPLGAATVTGAVPAGGNASPLLVTYTIAAPDGTWDAGDDGLYTVQLNASEVADSGGVFITAGVIGDFAANSSLVFVESFEAGSTSQFLNDSYVGDSGLVSVPDAFHNGDGDFWIRTDGASPAISTRTSSVGSPSYNGEHGDFYWAGQDLNDNGPDAGAEVPYNGAAGTGVQVLSLTNIDISGRTNLAFNGLFAADGTDGGDSAFDAGEGLMVEYSIDGGAFVKGLEFRTEFVSGDTTNLRMLHDTDMDGFGDGALITPTFTSYGFAIPSIGSSLTLRITADLDAGNEEMAFDDLQVTGDTVASNIAPTITDFSIPDVGEPGIGQTNYSFTVTYSDTSAIDVSTIDTNDVTVTGPGGIGNVPVTGVSVDVNTDGTPRTATYSFTPPSGSWDSADNGTYTVDMVANQVGDDDGSQAFVAPGVIDTFEVAANNSIPFVSNFFSFDVTAVDLGTADHSFIVEYSDGGVIDASSIGVSDISVSGPGGPLTVTGAVPAGGDASPLTVTYTVAAPGGDWDAGDDGLYTVTLNPNEVADNAGAFVPTGTLGQFDADSTILLIESFEAGSTAQFLNDTYVGDSGLVSVPDAFHNSDDDFWIRTNGASPPIATRTSAVGAPSYTGQDGSFYWAGEDLNDVGALANGEVPFNGAQGTGEQTLTISNIDISGRNNLAFSGLFAADGVDNSDSSPFRYDAGEGLMVEYSVDGGAFVKGLEFRTEFVSGDTTNLQMRHDADMDGFGEGAIIDPTFTEYGFAIPGTGTSLTLRITAQLDAGDEEMAFDLLELTGDLAATPVNLSVSSNAGAEAGTTDITVTATADAPVLGNATVDLDVTGLGITGGDYTLTDTTITINDGTTVGSVTFTVEDDGVVESDETATISIVGQSANLLPGTTTSQDVDITDNDSATVTISGAVSLDEAAGPSGSLDATLTFSPGATELGVPVTASLAGNADYSSSIAMFAAGSTAGTQTIDFTGLEDNFHEAAVETFPAESLDGTDGGADVTFAGTASIAVTDADIATLTIVSGANPVIVSESGGPGVPIEVELTFNQPNTETTGPISVELTENLDFNSNVVTFANGSMDGTTRTFLVSGLEDGIVEGTETFSAMPLTGTGDGSSNFVYSGVRDVQVLDNDSATVSISGTVDVAESSSATDTLVVTLAFSPGANELGEAVMVSLPGNADYTSNTGTFVAGATAGTVTLGVTGTVDDFLEEAIESFAGETLDVTAGGLDVTPIGSTTVNVLDGDRATFTIVSTPNPVELTEGGPAETVTVELSFNQPGTSLTLPITADLPGNGDYSSLAVTFAPGSTAGTQGGLSVQATEDDVVEATETYNSQALMGDGGDNVLYIGTRNIVIADDDQANLTINDVAVDESDGSLVFTVNLDAPIDIDMNFEANFGGGDATPGDDYNDSPIVFTFLAEETGDQTLLVPIVDDDFAELAETFIASLGVVTDPADRDIFFSDTGTGTINANDGTPALTLEIAAASIGEGDGAGATTAVVTRNTDTADLLIVSLLSDDDQEADVQAQVTIPAGQASSAPFAIDAVDDPDLDGVQTVTITASATGHADGTDTVDVLDDESPSNATGIDVQNGETQRSIVDTVQVLFDGNIGLQEIIDNGGIRVERFGINEFPVTPGTGTTVAFSGISVDGNSLRVDFAGGLGGVGSAGNGFYRIQVDNNNDGTFDDGDFEFFRLYGDGDGDGIVTNADSRLGVDLNGDGRYDSRDLRVVRSQLNTAVDQALLDLIDD